MSKAQCLASGDMGEPREILVDVLLFLYDFYEHESTMKNDEERDINRVFSKKTYLLVLFFCINPFLAIACKIGYVSLTRFFIMNEKLKYDL